MLSTFKFKKLRAKVKVEGKCPIGNDLLLYTSVCPVFRLIRSISQVPPVWTKCCGNVSQHPKPRINYTLVITPHPSLYVSPAIITYLLLTASPLSALQLFWTLCFLLFVSLSSDYVVLGVQYETVKDKKAQSRGQTVKQQIIKANNYLSLECNSNFFLESIILSKM